MQKTLSLFSLVALTSCTEALMSDAEKIEWMSGQWARDPSGCISQTFFEITPLGFSGRQAGTITFKSEAEIVHFTNTYTPLEHDMFLLLAQTAPENVAFLLHPEFEKDTLMMGRLPPYPKSMSLADVLNDLDREDVVVTGGNSLVRCDRQPAF